MYDYILPLFPTAPDIACVCVCVCVQFYSIYYSLSSSQESTDLLQLIHSRNYLPYAFPTDPSKQPTFATHHSNLPGQMIGSIDLNKLQDDILRTCIAGKPLIEDSCISSLRIPFKFKEDVSLGAFQLGLVLFIITAFAVCSTYSSDLTSSLFFYFYSLRDYLKVTLITDSVRIF